MVNTVTLSALPQVVVGTVASVLPSQEQNCVAVISFPAPGDAEQPGEWADVVACLAPGAHIGVVVNADRYPLVASAVEAGGAEVRDSIAVPLSDSFSDSKFVVVARTPMAGTVAETVLQHQAGVLNIDGCRTPVPSTSAKRDTRAEQPEPDMLDEHSPDGRYPTNLVLVHDHACRPAGTRTVKGITGTSAGRMAGKSSDVYGSYGGDATRAGERTGFADEFGNETIEAWNCGPRCGVAMVDDQSGELKSGVPGTMRLGENRSAAYGAESRPPGTPMTGYGDAGGASRFFPSCHDLTAVSEWLHTLLVTETGTVLDPWADNAPCVPESRAVMVCSSAQTAAALNSRRPTSRPEPDEDILAAPDEPLSLFKELA